MSQPQTPNNEVIDLSQPVEWLYKCDCPRCISGMHYNKEIAESYRKRGELNNEVGEIRAALGDDGRRTHKEILELASKASHWREWKQKYIDLKNAHIAEGQDPAGTIWEHADKLQGELKASQSEVARLREELQKLRLAAQAVVDRWETPLWKDAEPTASVIYRLRDALAPSPKEPVFIPTDLNQQNKENTLALNEWRELGHDEVIEDGDECRYKGEAQYEPLMDSMIGGKPKRFRFYLFRTRRPLPKQEEIPSKLDAEIEVIDTPATYSVTEARHATADSIRHLRDEIQKLKEGN